MVDYLATKALPSNGNAVVLAQLTRYQSDWNRGEVLQALFKLGVRWTEATDDEVTRVRRSLLGMTDGGFVATMKLLVLNDHCADDILVRLGRVPSMRTRVMKVGIGRLSSRTSDGALPDSKPPRVRLGMETPKPSRGKAGSTKRRAPRGRGPVATAVETE